MYKFGQYCYLLAEEQKAQKEQFNTSNQKYAHRCLERADNLYALADICGFKERDYKQYLFKKTEKQCSKCDYYNNNKYLPCAVHPELKDNCADFKPKQNTPPRKLEIQLPPERKRFILAEFTQLQLLYCCLVSMEEDWHHDFFCETALINHHEKLQNTEPEGSIWDAATKLPYEEILDLQERVRNFSSEDRWYFTHAINIFISF